MFQNPIFRPSHKKCRETIITQKVLVTQSSDIVHCNQHTPKPIYTNLQTFANTFSLCKLTFFSFLLGEFRKQSKFHILLILIGINALKWLQWHLFRVWGMLNPMPQVLSLCDKQFLKNHNFRRHIAENGVQNHGNGMGHMQHSSLCPILPLHHVSEPYI